MLLPNGSGSFGRINFANRAGGHFLRKYGGRLTAGRFPKRNHSRTKPLLTARAFRAPPLEEFYVSAIRNTDQICTQNISGA